MEKESGGDGVELFIDSCRGSGICEMNGRCDAGLWGLLGEAFGWADQLLSMSAQHIVQIIFGDSEIGSQEFLQCAAHIQPS